jgi:hypothetical protein
VDVTDLKTFEAVARLGGMNRAAAELHTVQSNVTAAFALGRIGSPLFSANRGVALTPRAPPAPLGRVWCLIAEHAGASPAMARRGRAERGLAQKPPLCGCRVSSHTRLSQVDLSWCPAPAERSNACSIIEWKGAFAWRAVTPDRSKGSFRRNWVVPEGKKVRLPVCPGGAANLQVVILLRALSPSGWKLARRGAVVVQRVRFHGTIDASGCVKVPASGSRYCQVLRRAAAQPGLSTERPLGSPRGSRICPSTAVLRRPRSTPLACARPARVNRMRRDQCPI